MCPACLKRETGTQNEFISPLREKMRESDKQANCCKKRKKELCLSAANSRLLVRPVMGLADLRAGQVEPLPGSLQRRNGNIALGSVWLALFQLLPPTESSEVSVNPTSYLPSVARGDPKGEGCEANEANTETPKYPTVTCRRGTSYS